MPPRSPGDASKKEDEARLFEREMRDVRPLPSGPRRVVQEPATFVSPAISRKGQPADASGRRVLQIEAWGDEARGLAPGVPRDRLRALGRGEISPEATVDLHGLDAAAARVRLSSFVVAAASAGRRCLLIVHGRGLRSGPAGPVLGQLVVEALGHLPLGRHVLAFTRAPAPLGGPGATIVLLRRHAAAPEQPKRS